MRDLDGQPRQLEALAAPEDLGRRHIAGRIGCVFRVSEVRAKSLIDQGVRPFRWQPQTELMDQPAGIGRSDLA